MTTIPPWLSVGSPAQPRLPGDVMPYARLAENTRTRRLWIGHSGLLEAQALMAYLAGHGVDVGFGSSVGLTPLQHPYQAALVARSVATLSARQYVAGFGTATPEFVTALHGRPYGRPRSAAVEFADIVRRLCAGEVLDQRGNDFGLRGLAPLEPGPQVEVGLGVLRPAMARSAGEVADAAITWLTPGPYVRDVLRPALVAGSERVGRSTPRVVTLVQVACDLPGRDRYALAGWAAGLHLEAPHYRAMLERAGVIEASATVDDAVARIVDRSVFLYGAPADIAARLRALVDDGVDEVVVKATGVHLDLGIRAAVDDLVAVVEAAGELSRPDRRPGTVAGGRR